MLKCFICEGQFPKYDTSWKLLLSLFLKDPTAIVLTKLSTVTTNGQSYVCNLACNDSKRSNYLLEKLSDQSI